MKYHYSFVWNVWLSNWQKLIARMYVKSVGGVARGEKRS